MTILAGARVVTPRRILEPGWVEIEHGRITRAGQFGRDGYRANAALARVEQLAQHQCIG
jgi:hypothetical protein